MGEYERGFQDGLRKAAKEISEGYERPGIYTKHDTCLHGKYEWEDCDLCAVLHLESLLDIPKPE